MLGDWSFSVLTSQSWNDFGENQRMMRQIQGWANEKSKDTYMRFLVLLCFGFSPVLRFFMIRISSSPLDIHLLKTVEWGRKCWKRYHDIDELRILSQKCISCISGGERLELDHPEVSLPESLPTELSQAMSVSPGKSEIFHPSQIVFRSSWHLDEIVVICRCCQPFPSQLFHFLCLEKTERYQFARAAQANS